MAVSKKEYFEAIKEAMSTGEVSISPDEIIAFCDAEIEKLDHKTEKELAKQAENERLMEIVERALTHDFRPAADIAASIEEEDISAAKVQYRLGQLVKDGKAEKTDVTLNDEKGKRVVKGYRLA